MLTALAQFLRERGVPAGEVAEYVRAEAAASGLDLTSMAEYAGRPPGTWKETIIVVISDPRFVSQSTLFSGICDEITTASTYEIAVLSDWSSRSQHIQHLKTIRAHHPAALLIVSQTAEGGEAAELRSRIVADGIPIVSCQPTQAKGEVMVRVDERRLMHLALSHLLGIGHRRIGALFVRDHPVQDERFRGLQEAIVKHKLATDDLAIRWASAESEHRVVGQPLEQAPVLRAATHLAQQERLTAILAPSDMAAVSLLLGLRAEGRRCPQDVSVLAIRPCAWMDQLLSPPLSHINPPYYETGRKAGRTALNMVRGIPIKPDVLDASHLHDYVICARTGGMVGPPRSP
jgi:DNA-binding LacI/PurR family transcriptional regulator